jgi:hypothetical protein
MLDLRIYRTGLAVVALALVVLAFSLRDQQAALSPTLAPEAFNGPNVYAKIGRLANDYPYRRPGSNGDDALASEVARTLAGDPGQQQFSVSTDTFTGRTADGTRQLENVVAVKPGMTSGSIVIVAHRDGIGSPDLASLSATATLMELGRDLGGETLNRTVVLASTSGSQGTAGAIRLASRLSGPIDAVIVLGDLASAHPHQPIVIPWATRQVVSPPLLRNTLAAALAAQTSLGAGSTGLGGQFAHLAFPFTLGEQAPFAALGLPAVELSLSGERGPTADQAIGSAAQLTALGRAVLQTVSALDGGPTVPAASTYLLFAGKVVPGWALSLFVLALLVPVVMTMIDGVARARRRGHAIWRSLVLVVCAALPFLLPVLVVLAAGLTGVIPVTPPGPVAPGVVPLTGAGIAVIVVAALLMVASAAGVRAVAQRLRAATPAPGSRARGPERASDGAVAAVLLVMCVVTFAIWLANPFAAALLVPALHLWLWAVNPDLRLAFPARLALVLVGLVPAALVVVYYANELGYGPVAVAWAAVLLLAGHAVSVLAALEWSVVLGCVVSVATIAVMAARGSRVAPAAVTVRGPVTYAGPGSLGGTKSALRR